MPERKKSSVPILRIRKGDSLKTIYAKAHRAIGRLDESDIVAHQDTDAVALPDIEPMQSAGDPVGAIGDIGVTAPALAADNAEKQR